MASQLRRVAAASASDNCAAGSGTWLEGSAASVRKTATAASSSGDTGNPPGEMTAAALTSRVGLTPGERARESTAPESRAPYGSRNERNRLLGEKDRLPGSLEDAQHGVPRRCKRCRAGAEAQRATCIGDQPIAVQAVPVAVRVDGLELRVQLRQPRERRRVMAGRPKGLRSR